MSRIVPDTIDEIIRLDKELVRIKEQCDKVTITKDRCDKELARIKEQCEKLARTKGMCEEEYTRTKEKRNALIQKLPHTFVNYEPQKPFNLSVMMESLPSDYNLTNPKIKQDERMRYDKEMEIYNLFI